MFHFLCYFSTLDIPKKFRKQLLTNVESMSRLSRSANLLKYDLDKTAFTKQTNNTRSIVEALKQDNDSF